MATQAAGFESVISISKDGEALKGIGEIFSSEQFTGTGIFSLSVDLLSGVNGLNPKIDLARVADFIAVNHAAYWARYRSSSGGVARISRYPNTLANYWEVKTNDSRASGYGTPSRLSQEATTADPAAVQDPAGQHNKPIFANDGTLSGPGPLDGWLREGFSEAENWATSA